MNSIVDKKWIERWQATSECKEPGLYDVILHNDDFTPISFVIQLLKTYFYLDEVKAKTVTLVAHTKGRAVCGTYSKEVAETRIAQVMAYARTCGHPLRWSMEEC